MATSWRGRPSRSAPRRISGPVVVHASTPVASTASVALQRIDTASQPPSGETNGSTTTKRTNGASIASRPASIRGSARAKAATASKRAASAAYGHSSSPRGTSATANTKTIVASTLHSAGARCSGVSTAATTSWCALLIGPPSSGRIAPRAILPAKRARRAGLRRDRRREVGGGAVGGDQRLAGTAELLAVDGAAPVVVDRAQHGRQAAATLVDDHGVEGGQRLSPRLVPRRVGHEREPFVALGQHGPRARREVLHR